MIIDIIKKNLKVCFGVTLIGMSIYFLYSAMDIASVSGFASNILLGQGSVLMIWGVKEIFEGVYKIIKERRRRNKQ